MQKKALEIGDTAYLLVSGKKVYDGGSKELLAHESYHRCISALRPTPVP